MAALERDPRVLYPIGAGIGRLGYSLEAVADFDVLVALLSDPEDTAPALVLVDFAALPEGWIDLARLTRWTRAPVVVTTDRPSGAFGVRAGRLGAMEVLGRAVDPALLVAIAEGSVSPNVIDRAMTMDEVHGEHVDLVMRLCRGVVAQVARVLDVDDKTVRRWRDKGVYCTNRDARQHWD